MLKILKPIVAAGVLAGLLLPFAPAQAQWVFVARKALGRIHQMTEATSRTAGPATTSRPSCSTPLPTGSSRPRSSLRGRTRRCGC